MASKIGGIKTELLPCPFCGADARETDRINSNVVTCTGCGARVAQSELGMGDADTRWNRREPSNDPALALIAYMVENPYDDPMLLLRLWNEGDFDAIRKEWPSVPDEVFIGADPLFRPSAGGAHG